MKRKLPNGPDYEWLERREQHKRKRFRRRRRTRLPDWRFSRSDRNTRGWVRENERYDAKPYVPLAWWTRLARVLRGED